MTGSVTSSEILIFSNLKLHSSILVSKSVSSLFRVFMFLRTRSAKLKKHELIIQRFSLLGAYGGVSPSTENLLNPLYLQKFPSQLPPEFTELKF